MRRIVTAISAAALAFSLVAQAMPANAAVATYDSAYAGESAFLTLTAGQSGTFTVFFLNTGTTGWVRGTATQVDLAACLEDKVTCNAQDASEATYNSGWLSATRYATHTQTSVAPGQVGTFTYNVAVPVGASAGLHRFNGATVLSSSGADIHNEGYYQDVNVTVSAAAPTLTILSPTEGSLAGGTSVTFTGTGFVCTPAFPTSDWGGAAGTTTSCSSTEIKVTTPAHAAGTVNVTVSNLGSAASNALSYTFKDTTKPTYESVTVQSGSATLAFSEAICENAALAGGDFVITINGIAAAWTGDSLAACDPVAAPHAATATSFIVTFTPAAVNGDFVAVTVNAAGAAKIDDNTGNKMTTAQTRTATATADTTKPSISTAALTSTTTLKLTYSERVRCPAADDLTQFSIHSSSGTPADQAPTAYSCSTSATGSTTNTLTFATAFSTGVGGTVTYTAGTDPSLDLAGNAASTPQTVAFGGFAADTTPPTASDTQLTTNTCFASQLDACSGDVFKIGFSEEMSISTSSAVIRVQDADGTVADIICVGTGTNATCAFNSATAALGGVDYDADMLLTVTLTANPTVITGFEGTVPGVQLPATIVDIAGITDTAGNSPNVSGSADRVIEDE